MRRSDERKSENVRSVDIEHEPTTEGLACVGGDAKRPHTNTHAHTHAGMAQGSNPPPAMFISCRSPRVLTCQYRAEWQGGSPPLSGSVNLLTGWDSTADPAPHTLDLQHSVRDTA
ncbi:unnamed protein product [Leuciscus chuanchicus]